MRDHGGNIDWAKLHYGGEDWIDLSTGINRVPYPTGQIRQDAWTALPTKAATADLCAAARSRYRLTDDGGIAVFSGAQGAIQLYPHLWQPGDARIFGPTYNEHQATLERAGWRVTIVSEIDDIRGGDLGVVVNPNNPGGEHFEPGLLLSLKGDVGCLIVDESFIDATPDLTLAPWLGDSGLLVLRSFGKFYGLAGLRLGFLLGNSQEVRRISEMAGPWPVAGPAIEIGTRALRDEAWVMETVQRLRRDADAIDQIVESRGWIKRGGTALFRLYECRDAIAAQAELAGHAIWTRIFPWSDHLVRLGLPGTETEWKRLRHTLQSPGLNFRQQG